MVRKVCLILAMALLVPLGLMAPVSAATAAPTWACPPTEPVVQTTWGPQGYDPVYMRNLCGKATAAQPPSSVKFSGLSGSDQSTRKAALGLPGAFAMDDQFAPILQTMQQGVKFVVVANYVGQRFLAQGSNGIVQLALREKLHQLLSENDEVILYTSSTGGPLASEVIGNPSDITVINPLSSAERKKIVLNALCSPAGYGTLSTSSQTSAIAAFVAQVLGEVLELSLFREPLLKLGGHAEYGSLYQVDQATYNLYYQPLQAGALADLKNIRYFAVTDDETVNDQAAYDTWKKMRGGDVPLYTVEGKHVAFGQNPAGWNAAIASAMAEPAPAP